jgi:hypothetical protein
MQCASNRHPSILVHYTHDITEKPEPDDNLVGPWHETIGYMIVPIYIILDRTARQRVLVCVQRVEQNSLCLPAIAYINRLVHRMPWHR